MPFADILSIDVDFTREVISSVSRLDADIKFLEESGHNASQRDAYDQTHPPGRRGNPATNFPCNGVHIQLIFGKGSSINANGCRYLIESRHA